MNVTATLRNLRISPRKVRLVSCAVKGMDALRARHQLAYVAKRSAIPMTKLLDSAMANAKQNWGMVKENLYIKDVIVNEGMKLKRGRPKGFGSVSPIEKKTSHITIVLAERVPGMRVAANEKNVANESEIVAAKNVAVTVKKPMVPDKEKNVPKATSTRTVRKIFQRKTV